MVHDEHTTSPVRNRLEILESRRSEKYVYVILRIPRLWHLLTPREKKVATLCGHGLTGKEIAKDLGITHATVNIHKRHIFVKLDIKEKGALILYAAVEEFEKESTKHA